MKTSDSINELAAALCKAQAAMRTAPMSGTNPHLRNRYATLNDIIDTARGPLADNGLSYVQMPCNPDAIDIPFIGLTTRIMHSSGQWLETTVYFPMDGGANKAVSAVQAAGSVLTYMRRYALGAALGIVADEDADGNAPPARQQPPTPPANAKPTAAQQYKDGSTVNQREIPYYRQHVAATGDAPENVAALREWYKLDKNGKNPPVIEPNPDSDGWLSAGQPALVTDNPDARQAALDTAAGKLG